MTCQRHINKQKAMSVAITLCIGWQPLCKLVLKEVDIK